MAHLSSTYITRAGNGQKNWQRSSTSVGKIDLPIGLVDQESAFRELIGGSWRNEVPSGTWFSLENDLHGNRSTHVSKSIREEYTK